MGLVSEEDERFVEGRQVGTEFTQGGQRTVADGPARSAVADLVQVVRVGDDELAVVEPHHVELDQVDPGLDRCAEGRQRVLGRERGCSAVPDAERSTVSPIERDHGLVGR